MANITNTSIINNKFYVYVYFDPTKPGKYNYGEYEFDYEPFYVGKGCFGKSYIDRIDYHWKSLSSFLDENKQIITKKVRKTGDNLPKMIRIKKLLDMGFKSICFCYKFKIDLEENDAYKLEEDMIKVIGRRSKKLGPLLNLTDGGEYHRFVKPWNKGLTKENNEILKRLSNERIGQGNPMYGCCGKDNPLYGRKRLIPSPMKGQKHTNDTKRIMKLKKEKYLYIIYKNDIEIERTFSLKDFCKDYNLNYNSLKMYVRNNQKYLKEYFVERKLREIL